MGRNWAVVLAQVEQVATEERAQEVRGPELRVLDPSPWVSRELVRDCHQKYPQRATTQENLQAPGCERPEPGIDSAQAK